MTKIQPRSSKTDTSTENANFSTLHVFFFFRMLNKLKMSNVHVYTHIKYDARVSESMCTQITVQKPQEVCVLLSGYIANYAGVTGLQDGKLGRQGSVSLSQFEARKKVHYLIHTLT